MIDLNLKGTNYTFKQGKKILICLINHKNNFLQKLMEYFLD